MSGAFDDLGIAFFRRDYPSANTVLLHGPCPVLVDTGFGSDAPELVPWLRAHGVAPEALALVVNTHFHSDHVGGNHHLQSRWRTEIAAQADEAAAVNGRDRDACRAQWLCQPVEAYRVGRALRAGERIETGETSWEVIETPGHTAGHISLWCQARRAVVLGDALHDADLGWVGPYREGPDAARRAAETVGRIARLGARVGFSGHGPAILDMDAAVERARRRLRSWAEKPQLMAWHACKRVFGHALILADGMEEAEALAYLEAAPWSRDHAEHGFGLSAREFAPRLVAEMVRSGAATRRRGRLVATAPYRAPPPGWAAGPTAPAAWPGA